MQAINLNNVQSIRDSLNSSEIEKLNKAIQSPDIIEFLNEVTHYSKKTHLRIVLIIITIIAIVYLVSIYSSNYYTILSGLVSAIILFSWNGYYQFTRVNERVNKKLFHVLVKCVDPKLQYSYEGSRPFVSDEPILMKYGFLNYYTRLNSCNHQIELKIPENSDFSMHGYELKTSKMVTNGKNRQSEPTNEHYLIKIQIPLNKLAKKVMIFPIKQKENFFGFPHPKSCKTIYEEATPHKFITCVFISIFSFLYLLSMYNADGVKHYLVLTAIFSSIIFVIFLSIKMKKESTGKHILLGNKEFDSNYKIFKTDQNTIDTFFTAKLTDSLNSLARNSGNKYSFLFINDTIYIKRAISRMYYMNIRITTNMNKNLSNLVRFYLDVKEIYTLGHEMNKIFKN